MFKNNTTIYLFLSCIMFFICISSNTYESNNDKQLSDSEKKEIIIAKLENNSCKWEGIPLKGKVQFVESFPDIKVQFVNSFPDIKVKFVESFPDDCGEWQVVESFPDFKVQIVESFPDIKIQEVSSFPGI